MAGASQSVSPRAGVVFDVARADVEGDHLVVSGHWSGVRGMRFLRPTLIVGGRALLATLEHKPWAPEADPWVAAFPWPGGKVDLDEIALAVAPSITVPLVPGNDVQPEVRPVPAAPAPAAPDDGYRMRLDRMLTEVGFLRGQIDALTMERDALRAERDRVSTPRDEAIRDSEAAVRTRQRMEAQRDEAVAALASVEASRDVALGQRAEAQAQRDEVLLAHEALQRHVSTTLADDGRQRFTRDATPPRDLGPDEPMGVRTIPATRAVAPELERTRRPPRRDVSLADMWAIRVFGSVAAVCFIALLAMILRVFL